MASWFFETRSELNHAMMCETLSGALASGISMDTLGPMLLSQAELEILDFSLLYIIYRWTEHAWWWFEVHQAKIVQVPLIIKLLDH